MSAHPLKRGIHVGAAAHQHCAWGGGRGHVIGIAHSKVGVLFGGKSRRERLANRDGNGDEFFHDELRAAMVAPADGNCKLA